MTIMDQMIGMYVLCLESLSVFDPGEWTSFRTCSSLQTKIKLCSSATMLKQKRRYSGSDMVLMDAD